MLRIMKGIHYSLLVIFLFVVTVWCQRCEDESYDGASGIYQEAEDLNVDLVQWRCENCNCCDTEDMHNASATDVGGLCETPSVFWFDPAKIGSRSRYQCSEGEASRMAIDLKRCNDPTYEFFNDGCCCSGCTEPVEILLELSDDDGGIGEAPANKSDSLCQCGPGLR